MINSMDKIDSWHLQRWGKFTASENVKLFSPAKDSMFGEGAWTYINSKALQMITHMEERPELEEVKSLLHGKVHEYPAFSRYVNTTRNFNMVYMGDENPIFLDHEELMHEAGGTPDAGIIDMRNYKVELGLEIKCPRNSMYHFERLKWKNQWDIKEGYKLVYTQIQHLLLISGAPEWHFVSFDDRFKREADKMKIIEVKPDKPFQGKLMIRLEKAIAEKYRTIANLWDIDEIVDRESFLKYAA
jgi:hypothetical protein